jgi:hypothetical protein
MWDPENLEIYRPDDESPRTEPGHWKRAQEWEEGQLPLPFDIIDEAIVHGLPMHVEGGTGRAYEVSGTTAVDERLDEVSSEDLVALLSAMNRAHGGGRSVLWEEMRRLSQQARDAIRTRRFAVLPGLMDSMERLLGASYGRNPALILMTNLLRELANPPAHLTPMINETVTGRVSAAQEEIYRQARELRSRLERIERVSEVEADRRSRWIRVAWILSAITMIAAIVYAFVSP